MDTVTLKGGFVVTPGGVIESDVRVCGGRISGFGGMSRGEVLDCRGLYILPGFRDQHIHDSNGFFNYLDDPGRFSSVSRALARQGVTAYMISTFAAPIGRLLRYLESVKRYASSARNGVDGALLEGANVEGTFIRVDCAGAQPVEYIVPPNSPDARKILDSILEVDVVRLINIVPDYGTDLIRYASSRGVIVGCGHCKATAKQLSDAVEAGLKYIVHMTNGFMGQSFKPFDGGGTYEGALTLPLFVELIVDGYHVDLRYVSDIIWRRVQLGRAHEVIAVTDGIFPIPEEIPSGVFRLYSTLCRRSEDDGVFMVAGRVGEDGQVTSVPSNTLCSSKLTMDRAFENLINMFTVDFQGFMIDHRALSLHEALRYAAYFTSTNQSIMQGVDGLTGSVEVGKRADLTVLRIDGSPGEYRVEVEKTLVAGRVFDYG